MFGVAIPIIIYFNVPLRFSTTHFSTGGPVPPGPPLKSPMMHKDGYLLYINTRMTNIEPCGAY